MILLAVMCLAFGATAQFPVQSATWGDPVKYPFEACAVNPFTSIYTTRVNKYFKDPMANNAWTMCFKITALDIDACWERNGYKNAQGQVVRGNETRCCDTNMNKLKLLVKPSCRGSIMHFTIDKGAGEVKSSSFTWDEWTRQGKKYLTLKFTPLYLQPNTADGVEICVRLKAPCATMQELSPNGNSLMWAMYDKKGTSNGKNYECCPMGVVPVETDTLEDDEPFMDMSPPPPARSPSPPRPKKSPPPPKKPSPPRVNKKKSPPPPRA